MQKSSTTSTMAMLSSDLQNTKKVMKHYKESYYVTKHKVLQKVTK